VGVGRAAGVREYVGAGAGRFLWIRGRRVGDCVGAGA